MLVQEYGCKVESGLQKAILVEIATLMEGVLARLDVNQPFDDVKRLILNTSVEWPRWTLATSCVQNNGLITKKEEHLRTSV